MKGKVTSTKKKSLLYFSVFPLILLLCLGIGCDKNDNDDNDVLGPGSTETNVASVTEMWDNYEAAVLAGDAVIFASLWDKNSIRKAYGVPAVYGPENIRVFMEPVFEAFDSVIIVEEEGNQVAGDWAFSEGEYTLSFTPKTGGDTGVVDGKFLTIFKKQADGSWKIYIDCFNLNTSN